MCYKKIPVIFLALALGAIPCPSSAQETDTEQNYRAALETARAGQPQEALPTLRALAEQHPDKINYLYDLITVLSWAGQHQEAVQRAEKLDLSNAPSYVLDNLAKSARSSGHYPLAEKLYRTLLGRDAKNWQAYVGLAFTLADSQRIEESIALLNDIKDGFTAIDQDGQQPLKMVQEYVAQRHLQQTEAQYRAILDRARAGHPRDALPYLRQQLQQHPEETRYRYDLITVLDWASQDQEAIQLGGSLDRQTTPSYVLLSVAKAARNTRDYALAIALYQAILHREPNNRQAQAGWALALSDNQQPDQALRWLNIWLKTIPAAQSADRKPLLEARRYAAIRQEKQQAEARYQASLAQARAGDPQGALPALRELVKRYPEDMRYRYDLSTVLAWAGQDREALQVGGRFDRRQTPVYVLTTLAKSARNVGNDTLATELYRSVLRRDPGNWQIRVELAKWLADQRQADAALQLLHAQLRANPSSPTPERTALLHAQAYVFERQTDFLQAAATYQEILQLDPTDHTAQRQLVLLTDRIGAPQLALALAARYPEALNAQELNAIKHHSTALQIRWGEVWNDIETGPARFADTDRALTDSSELQRSLRQTDQQGTPAMNHAIFDEMVALRDRIRMQEVIARYETLTAHHVDIPPYALAAAADAYLYERQPERARQLYREALAQQSPNAQNPEWQRGLFYAEVESEDFDSAQGLIDKVTQPGDKLWVDSRLAFERWDEAEQWAAGVLAKAPANFYARSKQASVQAARGQRRAAHRTYGQMLADFPDSLTARIGHAETQLALARYPEAEREIADLVADYPENRAVQRTASEWREQNSWLFSLDSVVGGSNDISAVFGNRDLYAQSFLYSPPIDYYYRGYVRLFDSEARFQDNQKATRSRFGIGLEKRTTDWEWVAELNGNLDSNGDPGANLALVYKPNDFWSFKGAYQSNTDDIPLKAVLNDIQAQLYLINATYSPNEARQLRFTFGYEPFDDDNNRFFINNSWLERLKNAPHYKLDAYFNLYASQNSASNVPYFNPEQDASFDVTLVNEWISWREYESSFKQRLVLTLGDYWQKNYGNGEIYGMRYEQEWERARDIDVRYGLGWLDRPYDGAPENRFYLYLTLSKRF